MRIEARKNTEKYALLTSPDDIQMKLNSKLIILVKEVGTLAGFDVLNMNIELSGTRPICI